MLGRASAACLPSSTVIPVLRRGARNDEVKTIAIRVFAGPNFAFDVERLELASHVFPSRNPSSEPTVKTYGLRGDWG